MKKALRMTFDPMTIEHLGVRMYSTLPPVLGELIANAYDADASCVWIHLQDKAEKVITVQDDGVGMSLEEINTKFLRIGRNRRKEDRLEVTPKGRKVIGKKGLGKLSFFGIAHVIKVTTCQAGKKTSFIMHWDSIQQAAGTKNGLSEYSPEILDKEVECDDDDGTIIELSEIERVTGFDADSLINSLSRIFICDDSFRIKVVHNDSQPMEVTEERRFANLDKQFEWNIPQDICLTSDYKNKDVLTGYLFAASKPISPRTNMRGITLFSRNKLVNAPEYFSDNTSSHFYSYLSGWLEVDFVDDLPEDVIGTNRQALNWSHPEMKKMRHYLQQLMRALEKDWRAKRRHQRKKDIGSKLKVDIESWCKALPADAESKVSLILENVVEDSELEDAEQHQVVRALHELVPEYPQYHWRHLHPVIREASKSDYVKEDYYRAFQEAAKRYITRTRTDSSSTASTDHSMMGEVYGHDKRLAVTRGYRRPDGSKFTRSTLKDIEEGQKFLSMGIVAGGRNPVSHEEIADLRDSGLFSEKDCLDGLSLLSHLMRRLEDACNVSRL